MAMKNTLWLLAAAVIGALLGARPNAAHAATLTIGDPAPPITVKAFVKGSPVTKLPAGKVSVVEFWATWCGPCKESIPHLTAMAKKFPAVTFVGVSVWEHDQSGVAPFVKSMGAKMDYHVCMDSVPAGADGDEGKMARAWMAAAGQDGIPTAFIVGKDGRIDWIGHPMEMEEPLTRITAGKWDLAAAKSEIQHKQALDAVLAALQPKIQAAAQTGDKAKILAVIEQGVAEHPEAESMLGLIKFSLLMGNGNLDAAATYGHHLVASPLKDDADSLNELSWTIVDPKAQVKPNAALLAMALEAAQRADSVSNGKSGEVADTLAAAYFANGKTAEAVSTEKRALSLVGDSNPDESKQMKALLAQYESGARK